MSRNMSRQQDNAKNNYDCLTHMLLMTDPLVRQFDKEKPEKDYPEEFVDDILVKSFIKEIEE